MTDLSQALLIGLCLLAPSIQADEKRSPLDRASMLVTGGTALTTFGTLGTTSHPDQIFRSAKDDALAFVGSEGEVRGARLEQALRCYRSLNATSAASDMQLAQAFAVSDR